MNILIARFSHETNTFSPVPTPLAAFGGGDPRGALYGADALRAGRGAPLPIGAMIAAAEARGCTLITPVIAAALPSGPVAATAYSHITEVICKAVATTKPDAILLDLHGAMVAENAGDGEGTLLERIRALAPTTPIAVALDLHANVSPAMVANANIIVGYKTYPHIDMVETGAHAARLLFDVLDGKIKPVLAYAQPPQLAHTLEMDTNKGAMKLAIDGAEAREREPRILACNVFGGFPLADTRHAGMSVVVCTDGDANLAQRTADWGSRFLWSRRRQFVYRQTPLTKALQQAKRIKDGPIILLDHGDNCMSGGTCDTVDVPRTALELGLAALLVGPTCDPAAVQACVKAGVGARIKLKFGGNTPMPRAGVRRPVKLNITATIRAISDGQYTVSGPIFNGSTQHMGTSVFVTFGGDQEHGIVLTTHPHEPLDLGCFTSLGVTMGDYRYWMLKSRMYYQPVFAPLAKQVIACASAGATSSDYAPFKFTQIRRPIYPLKT